MNIERIKLINGDRLLFLVARATAAQDGRDPLTKDEGVELDWLLTRYYKEQRIVE